MSMQDGTHSRQDRSRSSDEVDKVTSEMAKRASDSQMRQPIDASEEANRGEGGAVDEESTRFIATMRSAKRGRFGDTVARQSFRRGTNASSSYPARSSQSYLGTSIFGTTPAQLIGEELQGQAEIAPMSNATTLHANMSTLLFPSDSTSFPQRSSDILDSESDPNLMSHSSRTSSVSMSSSSLDPNLHSTNTNFLLRSDLYRGPLQHPSSNAIENINYGHPYFRPSSDNSPAQIAAPTPFESSRRTWLPQSQYLSANQQYQGPPLATLPLQNPILSEQQRGSNFLPTSSQHLYPYTSSEVPRPNSSSSGQYENTAMSSVGVSTNDGSSSQGAYEASQRSERSMQLAAQQYQQQSQQEYLSGANLIQGALQRTDASHATPDTTQRLQQGRRSDFSSDQDSTSASSSTDWNSLQNLRLQQLRGGHAESSFLSTSPSDHSSERAGGKKRHQSRARLKTHLRQLQAEMADLKQRVRAAEDLYRETSPITGSTTSSGDPSSNRLTDVSSNFTRKSTSGPDDVEMQDERYETGANMSPGGGVTMAGLSSIYSASFPQSLNTSSMPSTSALEGGRRPQPYSTGMPSRSSTGSSSSSAINTVLGRRGTWRSEEGGKVLVFNAGGTGDYEYSARPSTSRNSGAGLEGSMEKREGNRAAEEDEMVEGGDEDDESKMEEGASTSGIGAEVAGGDENANKRYQCLVSGCLKTFTTSGHARRHSRTHLGHKLFVCPHDGCGSTFTRRDNCRQHQRARHQSTLPVYELTETDTLEHLILDRQQEEQERQRQYQQEMHVLHNMGDDGIAPPPLLPPPETR